MLRSSRSHFLSSFLEGAAILAVFSIPLGTRALFGFVTPGFDEYESFFLYASDVAVILFLALLSIKERAWLPGTLRSLPKAAVLGGAALFLGALLSLSSAVSLPLALYAFVRLLLGALFAFGLAAAVGRKFVPAPFLLGSLAASGVFQALVAFFQFRAQGSIGLSLLGEPTLGPLVGGAAKIIVAGGALLRGYGTLPHPNVLAAVLVVAFLATSYFWLRRPGIQKAWHGGAPFRSDILLGVALFVVATGLALTFSRAGWFVAGLVAAFLAAGAVARKELRIQAVRYAVLSSAALLLVILMLGWALFPRAALSRGEPAVQARLRYNDLGVMLIKERPLGVGIGNQVLYAVERGRYFDLGMRERWQWQPVHNIYLLAAAEVGLLGLVGFLLLFLGALYAALRHLTAHKDGWLEVGVPAVALGALLALGLFDHYLWTLQPGRLLLWGVLGILLGLISGKKPPS